MKKGSVKSNKSVKVVSSLLKKQPASTSSSKAIKNPNGKPTGKP